MLFGDRIIQKKFVLLIGLLIVTNALLILIPISIPNNSARFYTSTHNLFPGGNIGAIWVGPKDELVIGLVGSGGLYYSKDQGFSWHASNFDGTIISDATVTNIVSSQTRPNYLVATVWSQGIAISDDMGKNWRWANNDSLLGNPEAVAVSNSEAPIIYVATNDSQNLRPNLYKSVNNGVSWVDLDVGKSVESYIYSLATDPDLPDVLYAGAGNGIYKTTDAGKTWHKLDGVDIRVETIAISPDANRSIYISGRGAWLGSSFKSIDSGKTWNKLPLSVVLSYTTNESGSSTLALSNNSIFHDVNTDWELLTANLPSRFSQLKFSRKYPNRIYGATALGFFRSDNGGYTWTASNRGLLEFQARLKAQIADESSSFWLASNNSTGSLIRSRDGGFSWENIDSLPEPCWILDTSDPNRIFGITRYNNLYESQNLGITWSLLRSFDFPTVPTTIASSPSHILYIGTSEGNLYKYDLGGGELLEDVSFDFKANSIDLIEIDPSNPDRLLISGKPFGLARSDDQGKNWEVISPLQPVDLIWAGRSRLYALNLSQIYGEDELIHASTSLVVSLDYGETWQEIQKNVSNSTWQFVNEHKSSLGLSIDSLNPEKVYISLPRGEIVSLSPILFSTFEAGFYLLCLVLSVVLCCLMYRRGDGGVLIKLFALILALLSILGLLMLGLAIIGNHRDLYAFITRIILFEVVLISLYLINSADSVYQNNFGNIPLVSPFGRLIFGTLLILTSLWGLATVKVFKYIVSFSDFSIELLLLATLCVYYYSYRRNNLIKNHILFQLSIWPFVAGVVTTITLWVIYVMSKSALFAIQTEDLFVVAAAIVVFGSASLFFFEKHVVKPAVSDYIQGQIQGGLAGNIDAETKHAVWQSVIKSLIYKLFNVLLVFRKWALPWRYVSAVVAILIVLLMFFRSVYFSNLSTNNEIDATIAAVNNLTFITSERDITLVWDADISKMVAGYHVYLDADINSPEINSLRLIASVEEPNHSITIPRTDYWRPSVAPQWGMSNLLDKLSGRFTIDDDKPYRFVIKSYNKNRAEGSVFSDITITPFRSGVYMLYDENSNSSLPLIERSSVNNLRFLNTDNSLWIAGAGNQVREINQNQATNFPLPTSSISSNEIKSIQSDDHGRTWVLTSDGVNLVENNKVVQFPFAYSLPGIPNGTVNVLFEDAQKNIWVGTDQNLSSFNGKKWSYYVFPRHKSITAGYQSKDGKVWIGTSDGEVFTLVKGKWTSLTLKTNILPGAVTDLILSDSGQLLASTRTNIYQYINENWIPRSSNGLLKEISNLCTFEQNVAAIDKSTYSHIYVLSFDDNSVATVDIPQELVGKIEAISCGDKNDIILSGGNRLWRFDGTSIAKQIDLGSNLVNSGNLRFLGGIDNALWAITNTGLAQLTNDRWNLQGLFFTEQPFDSITTVLVDSSDKLWIGGNTGIAKYDNSSWKIFTNTTPHPEQFYNLVSDKYGQIWIPTNAGVLYWNQKNWQWFTIQNGIPNYSNLSLYLDKSERLWALAVGGISKWDMGTWIPIKFEYQEGPPIGEVGQIAQDSKGRIWFVDNTNSLCLYDHGVWSMFDRFETTSEGIKKIEAINFLTIDKNDNLWFSDSENLYLLNRDKLQIFNSKTSGLPNQSIRKILQGTQDDMWFLLSKKITHFSKGSWYTIELPITIDGFVEAEVDKSNNLWILSQNKAMKFTVSTTFEVNYDVILEDVVDMEEDISGNFWFASINGISMYDVDNQKLKAISSSFFDLTQVKSISASKTVPVIWFAAQSSFLHFDGISWHPYDCGKFCMPDKMIVDDKGFLWVYTSGGELVKFDGMKWAPLDVVKNDIRFGYDPVLFLDAENILWVSLDQGVLRLGKEVMEVYQNPTDKPGNLIESPVATLQNDFIAPLSNGVLRWDESKATVIKDPLGYSIKRIVRGEDNNIWLIDSNNIRLWDGDSTYQKVPAYSLPDGFRFPDGGSQFFQDHQGRLWLLNYFDPAYQDYFYWDYGSPILGIFDPKVDTILNSDTSSQLQDHFSNSYNGSSFISAYFVDIKGLTWIGSYNSLLAFDGTKWIDFTPTNTNDMPEGLIKSIFQAPNQHLWIEVSSGIYDFDGLHFWRQIHIPQGNNSSVIQSSYDENLKRLWAIGENWLGYFDGQNWNFETPPNFDLNALRSIYYVQDNKILVSNSKGQVAIFDQGNWHVYDLPGASDFVSQIKPISDSNGNLWLARTCSYDYYYAYLDDCTIGNLLRFDGVNWTVFTPLNSNLPNEEITQLIADHRGTIWVGTANGLLKIQGEKWEVLNSLNSNLPSNYIYGLYVDSANKLWVSTSEGVATFDNANWTLLETEKTFKDVGQPLVKKNGQIWIPTSTGLLYWNGEEWRLLTDKDGLPGNDILHISDDLINGNLQVITAEGASQWDRNGFNTVQFDTLSPQVILNGANQILRDDDGSLWVLSEQGISFSSDTEKWVSFTPKMIGAGKECIPKQLLFDVEDSTIVICENGLATHFVNSRWEVIDWGVKGFGYITINQMLRSLDGTVWLATNKGLARFDGNSWSFFTPSLTGFAGSAVLELTEDNQGRLWIRTRDSVAYYKDGNFKTISQNLGTWGKNSSGNGWTSITERENNILYGNSSLYSKPNPFFPGLNNRLAFNHNFNFSDYESGYLELSLDDGDNWLVLKEYFGSQPNSKYEVIPIAPFSTKSSSIMFRFRFNIESEGNSSRWSIDDVQFNGSPIEFFTDIDNFQALWENVTDMGSDSLGGMWFLSRSGVHYYKDDKWQQVVAENTEIDLSSFYRIISSVNSPTTYFESYGYLIEGKAGKLDIVHKNSSPVEADFVQFDLSNRLWLTIDNDLVTYNNGQWKLISSKNNRIITDSIKNVFVDEDGQVWLGTEGKLINLNGYEWKAFTSSAFRPRRVDPPYVDEKGTKWFATDSGILSYDGVSWYSFTQLNGLDDNNLRGFLENINGLMGAVTQTGINLWDGKSWTESSLNSYLLMNADITSINSPKEGGVWIGTKSNGLIKIAQDQSWVQYMNFEQEINVVDIAVDNNGVAWVATNVGLLANPDGNWTLFDVPDVNETEIKWVTTSHSGGIWAGASNYILNFDGQQWTKVHAPELELSAPLMIVSGSEDYQGCLWVSTSVGILKYANGKWSDLFEESGLSSLANISKIFPDRSGKVWFFLTTGTSGDGLAWVSGDTWNTVGVKRNELLSNEVFSIFEDQKGNIWVGTANGISKFDGQDWVQFRSPEALVGASINSIAQDKYGNLWFGTNRGLGHFDGKNWSIYSFQDGLLDENILDVAIDPTGTIWMRGSRNLWLYSIPPSNLLRVLTSIGSLMIVLLSAVYLGIRRRPSWRYNRYYDQLASSSKGFYQRLYKIIDIEQQPMPMFLHLEHRALSKGDNELFDIYHGFAQLGQEPLEFASINMFGQIADKHPTYNVPPQLSALYKFLVYLSTTTNKLQIAEFIKDVSVTDLVSVLQNNENTNDIKLPLGVSTIVALVEGLRQVSRNIDSAIRVQDRIASLSYVLEGASLLEKVASLVSLTSWPEQRVFERNIQRWKDIVDREIKSLRGEALLNVVLRTRNIILNKQSNLVFQIDNQGLADAENILLELRDTGGGKLFSKKIVEVKRLGSQQFLEVEFEVLYETQGVTSLLLLLTYDDHNISGRVLPIQPFLIKVSDKKSIFKAVDSPYVAGKPIDPESKAPFVGREDVFQWVKNSIQSAGQNNLLVIYGQRRTGKTSILRQIEAGRLGGHIHGVFVDLQGFGDPGAPALLEALTNVVAKKTGTNSLLPYTSKFREAAFQSAARYLEELDKFCKDKLILVMLDEFEVLQERVLRGVVEKEVFDFLRSQFQDRRNIAFLLVGTHELKRLADDSQNILFGMTLHREIDFLNRDEAIELIRKPAKDMLEYDDYAVETIIRATNGHPYLIQLVCFNIVEQINKLKESQFVTIREVRTVLDQLKKSENFHFQSEWDISTKEEKEVMMTLFELSSPGYIPVTGSSLVRLLLNRNLEIGYDILDKLIERKLIVRIPDMPREDKYRCATNLFQDWVLYRYRGRNR